MSNVSPYTPPVKTSHTHIRNRTYPRRSPSQWAEIMGRQGYTFRFFGDGEAVVTKPDGDTRYFVSLTGETFEQGCTCTGHQVHGRCKHVAVVSAFCPCDEHGCNGVMEYLEADTKFGPANRYECHTCGKTTDPRVAQDLRDKRRRQRMKATA